MKFGVEKNSGMPFSVLICILGIAVIVMFWNFMSHVYGEVFKSKIH